jgi:phosphohistidine phosphatase SixA
MINKNVPHIILSLFLSLLLLNVQANEINWKPAQDGNKIILIRHALAPGGGDPEGFKLKDCSTQRNLNQAGINQSQKIGDLFKKKDIPIDKVLSSQWCRCKDTAKYAFKNYKEFSALNSTFQSSDVEKNKKQLQELKKFVRNWNGNGGNLVLVTHYIIIASVTDAEPLSGEVVIIDKNFKVLSTIQTLNNIKKK